MNVTNTSLSPKPPTLILGQVSSYAFSIGDSVVTMAYGPLYLHISNRAINEISEDVGSKSLLFFNLGKRPSLEDLLAQC